MPNEPLQRRVQSSPTALEKRTNELARLLTLSHHRSTENCHQNHLSLVARIKQTSQYTSSGIDQLIQQSQSSALQAVTIHTTKKSQDYGLEGLAGFSSKDA